MKFKSIKYISIITFLLLHTIGVSAQSNAVVDLFVNKEDQAEKRNVVQLTVSIQNNSDKPFEGSLSITTPNGLKCVSGNNIVIHLAAGAKQYLPLTILIQKNAPAGNAEIELKVIDSSNNIITTQSITHVIEENNSIQLYNVHSTMYINEDNDLMQIKAGVNNSGNLSQHIALVLQITDLDGPKKFVEVTAILDPQQDTIIAIPISLPKNVYTLANIKIKIAGLRLPTKEPFGNISVTLQNAASRRRYAAAPTVINSSQKNSLSTSFRRIGNNTNILQVLGTGNVDLPLGYLSLKANIFKADNNPTPIATNTALTYFANNTQFSVGSISEVSELPVFGRGVKLSHTNSSNSSMLSIGAIDQNFNLLSNESVLRNGGAAFINNIWHSRQSGNSYSAGYIIKAEPWEMVTHQVVSGEMQKFINKDWRIQIKGYGGLSQYTLENKMQPSGAIEAQYTGKVSNVNIAGNYFYSTAYFPGNRRGATFLQQQFSKKLKGGSTFLSNIFYFNFAPRSITNLYQTNTENFKAEAGIILPPSRNVSFKILPQYQKESSLIPQYISQSPNGEAQNLSLNAIRIVEHLTWSSPLYKQNLSLLLEPGFALYPLKQNYEFQVRANAMYTIKWLSFNAIYQHGAYFLSEYLSAMQTGVAFQRLSLMASAKKNFLHNKVESYIGGSYFYDAQSGTTPSAFVNLIYKPKSTYALFINSNWFKYRNMFSTNSQAKNIVNIEAGITINFKDRAVSPSKKARVKSLVFYDNNTNGLFDEGDEVAKNYHLTFDKTAFKTDSNGYFQYRSVPFDTYKVKNQVQKGWFTPEKSFVVDKFNNRFEIPLHKNGTALGSIKYDFEQIKAVDFVPKAEGVIFSIYNGEDLIMRIPTNEEGQVTIMLPTGTYTAVLDVNSLPENTFCENNRYNFEIASGKMSKLPSFIIGVKQKKINIKKFGE